MQQPAPDRNDVAETVKSFGIKFADAARNAAAAFEALAAADREARTALNAYDRAYTRSRRQGA